MLDFFRHWCLFGFISRCLFGFPRLEQSFGFLTSSLPFCFFLQWVFSYFWVWGVPQIFSKFQFQLKIWQTFIFSKFVQIHFIFLIHWSNVYVPDWIKTLKQTFLVNVGWWNDPVPADGDTSLLDLPKGITQKLCIYNKKRLNSGILNG